VLDGVEHFVEFKFWMTMVKVRNGRLDVGKGNDTPGDYRRLKKDILKLGRIRGDPRRRYLVYVVQTQQYPDSKSELVPDLARQLEPANAVALFDNSSPQVRTVDIDGRGVRIEWALPPIVLSSRKGIEFKLYTYLVHPI
jgi:hypothetical protein